MTFLMHKKQATVKLVVLAALLILNTIGFAQNPLKQQILERYACKENELLRLVVDKYNPPIQDLWDNEKVSELDSILRVKSTKENIRLVSNSYIKLFPAKIDLIEKEYARNMGFTELGELFDKNDIATMYAFDIKYQIVYTYGSILVLPRLQNLNNSASVTGVSAEVFMTNNLYQDYQEIFTRWKTLYPSSYNALSNKYKTMIEEDFYSFFQLLEALNFNTKTIN
jgi:hypothetical protein